MVMWTIWHRRNQIRAKNEDYPISQVVPIAEQALQVFMQANHAAPTQSVTNASPQIRWTPPPTNYPKVNFDGATFKDIGRAGIDAVICDNHGQVIASLSEQVNLPFSSDMVEAQAAARAMSFALEIGCSSFILEGKLESVIKTLNSEGESFSPFGHILTAAKNLTNTTRISFSHVHRVGNFVAHNLAKHARHANGYLVGMEDVPPHLHSVLLVNSG